MGFQISLGYVLRSEGFYGGRSANPANNLLMKSMMNQYYPCWCRGDNIQADGSYLSISKKQKASSLFLGTAKRSMVLNGEQWTRVHLLATVARRSPSSLGTRNATVQSDITCALIEATEPALKVNTSD